MADIKILHGQRAGVATELDTLLGLGPLATNVITRWAVQATGRALWQVGERSYQVQTVLHPLEADLAFTHQAILGAR